MDTLDIPEDKLESELTDDDEEGGWESKEKSFYQPLSKIPLIPLI